MSYYFKSNIMHSSFYTNNISRKYAAYIWFLIVPLSKNCRKQFLKLLMELKQQGLDI